MTQSPTIAVSARDPRLDFFRGLAMFIIFIAHVPNNPWILWIPARFGFSDATEIFVFCSGMASAFAFGRIFETRGWLVGSARILYRAWQIYWVHIGLFVALAATLAALDASGRFGDVYLDSLNLKPFFADAEAGLIGLVSLTYVPNYFDILPMYFGILLLLPFVVAAHRVNPWLAAALVLGLWMLAQTGSLDLPAEPWTDRRWFFNPFGWQLVFFTGFALAGGWLPAPPVRAGLVRLAIAALALSVPFAYYAIIHEFAVIKAVADWLEPYADKSSFGALRYLHFLALAYLAFVAAGPGGARLRGLGPLAWVTPVIHKVGQQALATYVAGAFFARMILIIFETWGNGPLVVALANLLGFAVLIGTAYVVSWFRRERAASTRSPMAADVARPVASERPAQRTDKLPA